MNRAIIHKYLVSALLILTVVVSGAFSDAIPRKVQKGQEAWRSLKQAQNAFESNDFVHAIQIHTAHAKTLQTRAQEVAMTTRNDTNLISAADGVGDGVAIFGVVFTYEVCSTFDRHDTSIGHNAIDIEDEGFGLSNELFEILHRFCLVSFCC